MVPSGGHSGLVAADPQALASPLLPWTAALHEWLTLDPAERPCLIAVSDDATKRVFHAAWWSMTARLAAVLRTGSRPRPAPGGSVAEACDTRRSADGLDNAPLDRGLTGSFDTLVVLIGN